MVGSALVKLLVDSNTAVRILHRESSRLDLLGPYADAVEQCVGDIMDPVSIGPAMKGVSAVFHTAAVVGFDMKGSDDPYLANYDGTANVLNAAVEHGVDRVVHTSSIAAIGRDPDSSVVVNEARKWSPSRFNSKYAISKRKAEMEVHRAIAEGLDAVMVNPSLIFGESRPGENTSAILERIKMRKIPGIPAGGTNVVDVLDVAAGHVAALEKGRTGERYILGGENLSWRFIMGTLADAFGVDLTTRQLNPRFLIPAAHAIGFASRMVGRQAVITPETARITSRFYTYDCSKAIEDLGYAFRPFKETAERLATFFDG
ncbi:MAG: NAD-dependent epimerase/dehydratase family protein [Rhodothermales bacterium]|nr:NAD-dependent epimerase/dehydratase family protein [Rhodothermales bacterium]